MTNVHVKANVSEIFSQLAKNEGATIALAKMLLSENDFKIFLIEQQIQMCHNIIDMTYNFTEMFNEDLDELRSYFKNKTEEFELEKRKLIESFQDYKKSHNKL